MKIPNHGKKAELVEYRLRPVAFFQLWEQSVGCVVYYLKQNRSLLYNSMFICQYAILSPTTSTILLNSNLKFDKPIFDNM